MTPPLEGAEPRLAAELAAARLLVASCEDEIAWVTHRLDALFAKLVRLVADVEDAEAALASEDDALDACRRDPRQTTLGL